VYALIVVITLVIADLALIALGLFPPRVRPGHPEVGWVSAMPSGEMRESGCVEYSTGERMTYTRNEDGMRTPHSSKELREDSAAFTIAVGGDSQTEICVPNERAHFGVMERELRAGGVPAAVYAFGSGKYSPLQAYVALRRTLKDYSADAFVLNLYTGNDVYDMLRIDDRPHLVRAGDGYAIAPPIWYQEDPPGLVRRSRVLFALRSVAEATGVRNLTVRLRYLRDAAGEQGHGMGAVLSYMMDLRRSSSPELGYPAAFSAQMLNQQLFFHHFPGSRDESLRRVRALLEIIRREHPGLVLVLSPLPSYQLVLREQVDSTMLRVLARLPITNEAGIQQEGELYEALKGIAAESGWLYVDNLTPLRAYGDGAALYNAFDFHFLPPASEIIGRAQAETIGNHLRLSRK
jgi:hypothetical protein